MVNAAAIVFAACSLNGVKPRSWRSENARGNSNERRANQVIQQRVHGAYATGRRRQVGVGKAIVDANVVVGITEIGIGMKAAGTAAVHAKQRELLPYRRGSPEVALARRAGSGKPVLRVLEETGEAAARQWRVRRRQAANGGSTRYGKSLENQRTQFSRPKEHCCRVRF